MLRDGKNRDEITGFVTPYWTHLSDIENGDYDNVFSFTTPISSDLNNDLGELKALILARGDRKATYKDIVGLTSDEYNRSTADSIATGMSVMLQAQAQLDQLINRDDQQRLMIHFVRIQHLENLPEIQHPLPEQMRMVIPLRSHPE